jgi:hypothetical protein
MRMRSPLALLAVLAALPAAAASIDAATVAGVVDTFAKKIADNYVSAEAGKRAAADLRAALQRGEFKDMQDDDAFADKLSSVAQASLKDAHLDVMALPEDLEADRLPGEVPRADPASAARLGSAMQEAAKLNYGFRKSERLDGNIAYLAIDSFTQPEVAQQAVAYEMSRVRDASALIIDLRANGGGSARTGLLVAAYLFDDKPVHLADLVTRGWQRTEPLWTSPVASDLRFGARKPVYILIGKDTFSAAEGFAYALQANKRATIVGESSKGGAHQARGFRIGTRLLASIPAGLTLSPVTHRDWEGSGVQPDVKLAADKALEQATALARKAIGR